jgi:hypothetical protein
MFMKAIYNEAQNEVIIIKYLIILAKDSVFSAAPGFLVGQQAIEAVGFRAQVIVVA